MYQLGFNYKSQYKTKTNLKLYTLIDVLHTHQKEYHISFEEFK